MWVTLNLDTKKRKQLRPWVEAEGLEQRGPLCSGGQRITMAKPIAYFVSEF